MRCRSPAATAGPWMLAQPPWLVQLPGWAQPGLLVQSSGQAQPWLAGQGCWLISGRLKVPLQARVRAPTLERENTASFRVGQMTHREIGNQTPFLSGGHACSHGHSAVFGLACRRVQQACMHVWAGMHAGGSGRQVSCMHVWAGRDRGCLTHHGTHRENTRACRHPWKVVDGPALFCTSRRLQCRAGSWPRRN